MERTHLATDLADDLPADRRTESYRSLLRRLLIEKKRANPRFSLRAFAKSIGMQAPLLSMILNGKRELTDKRAFAILEKLRLKPDEERRFLLLLRLDKASSSRQREQVLQDLRLLDPELSDRRDFDLDQFRVISDWYHFPLQLLVDLKGFQWSEESAARALGITLAETRDALERLHALKLIEWRPGKNPVRRPGAFVAQSNSKNEALKEYHHRMLEKTATALDEQSPTHRFTGTQTLALCSEQLREARDLLQRTLNQLNDIAERPTPSKKKAVFHANLNLFQIAPLPIIPGVKK